MKRQFRDWDKLYAQYKQTDLSVAAFAEKRKIPLSVAYKQFHKRAVKEEDETNNKEVSFIPVTIKPTKDINEKKQASIDTEQKPINNAPEITIHAGKFTLHIPSGFDEKSLTSILKVIGGLC